MRWRQAIGIDERPPLDRHAYQSQGVDMRTTTLIFNRRLLFLLIPFVIGAGYLGRTVLSAARKQDTVTIKINNLTSSCELLNVERVKNGIKFSLHNLSSRAVTAYVVTSRADPQSLSTLTVEYATSEGDDTIASGASSDEHIGIPGGRDSEAKVTISLAAVIFDDKTSEGDTGVIAEIVACRLGDKLQLIKALAVFEKMALLSETELDTYLNRDGRRDLETALNEPDERSLIAEAARSSHSNDSHGDSEGLKSGVQSGRETVMRDYQELIDTGTRHGKPAQAVLRRINIYKKIIARL